MHVADHNTGLNCTQLEVVGLGRCTWDHVVLIDYVPEWDDPKAATVHQFTHSGGGPVATALAALGRLGARVGYIGTVGDDETGAAIQAGLVAEHVDVSRLRVLSGQRSRTTVVLVQAESGKRCFLAYPGTTTAVILDDQDRSYVATARVLHLDGDHSSAAATAAQWIRQTGGQVVLDAGFVTPDLPDLLPLVDVLITNRSFPARFTGSSDPSDAARCLLAFGPTLVVSTLAEGGCTCWSRQGHVHVPGFAVDVVDTTGAGDAFHGAFIYGMLRGWDTVRTATFSNAVAAIKCTGLGGRKALPTLEQTFAFLAARERSAG